MLRKLGQNKEKYIGQLRKLLMEVTCFSMMLFVFPIADNIGKKLILILPIGACFILLLSWREIISTVRHRRDMFFLALFCCVYFITILFNGKYNLVQNMKSLIWIGIYIVIFYLWEDEDATSYYKHIIRLNHIIIFISFFGNATSVAMFLLNYSAHYGVLPLGIDSTRLFGIYNGITSGSILALYSILASILNAALIQKYNLPYHYHRWIKFYIISGIAAYFYIIGSGCRTSKWCMVICVCIILGGCFYLFLKKKAHPTKQSIIRTLAAMASTAVLCICIASASEQLMVYFSNQVYGNYGTENDQDDKGDKQVSRDNQLQRTDESLEASMVARKDIWEQSILLWKNTHPIIGIGNANMKVYAEYKGLDRFFLLASGAYGESTHSMPIAVLLFSGVIGSIFVVAFFALRFWGIADFYFRNGEKWNKEFIKIYLSEVCVIVTLFLYSIMNSAILFNNVLESVLFWLYLGYMEKIFIDSRSGKLNEPGGC